MFPNNTLDNATTAKDIYYGKKEIMEIFHCESDKALKILKIMFQMREANKIGREYYVSKKALEKFMDDMKGKTIYI